MANAVITPQVAWELMLGELSDSGNLWDGAVVMPFKNNVALGPATVIGDLNECDFTGYAVSSAVVWGDPGYLPDGTAIVTGDAKVFRVGASPTVLNTVYGWALVNAAKDVLYFARKFESPVVLSTAGQIFAVLPAYPVYLTV